jgi:hypothetical protein
MIPGLGEKYDIDIEVISKPRSEYASEEYLLKGLPKAPAIMIGEEVIVAGRDISENDLGIAIRQFYHKANYEKSNNEI